MNNNDQTSFTKNDRVVWDSGYGYEIGYFEEDGNSFNTYLIDITTGRYPGNVSLPKGDIIKYSDEIIDELTKKYGYEKRFSEIF